MAVSCAKLHTQQEVVVEKSWRRDKERWLLRVRRHHSCRSARGQPKKTLLNDHHVLQLTCSPFAKTHSSPLRRITRSIHSSWKPHSALPTHSSPSGYAHHAQQAASLVLKYPFVQQETRLSALRTPTEFFDWHRISRPADMNQATSVRTMLSFQTIRNSQDHPQYSVYHTTLAISLVCMRSYPKPDPF